MADRAAQIATFLAAAGWGTAQQSPLAGDASARRYLRLAQGSARAVLMDAPPGSGEDVRPFIAIARHLHGLGLSAPAILAQDPAQGLLLLEDLGDGLYARVVAADPTQERTLYAAAVDLLAGLHRHPAPAGVPAYDAAAMARLAGMALEWYAPAAAAATTAAGAPAPTSADPAFVAQMEEALTAHAGPADVLVLRDFHAENLLWLPGRTGAARVGLLDFQDGARGCRGYDLISLLEDARRDVPSPLRAAMIARYAAATGQDHASFTRACAVLAAQRNLRILGIFARLCLRDGKPGYVRLMPRVWAHLADDLAHPALSALRGAVMARLPAPTPEICQAIEARCATIPKP